MVFSKPPDKLKQMSHALYPAHGIILANLILYRRFRTEVASGAADYFSEHFLACAGVTWSKHSKNSCWGFHLKANVCHWRASRMGIWRAGACSGKRSTVRRREWALMECLHGVWCFAVLPRSILTILWGEHYYKLIDWFNKYFSSTITYHELFTSKPDYKVLSLMELHWMM